MKKYFYLILLFSIPLFSQNLSSDSTGVKVIDSLNAKEKRWKFGCGVSMNFVGGTNLSLSPNVVYKLNDKFSIGGGIQGTYASTKNVQKVITYGLTATGLYNPISKMVLSVDFIELFVNKTLLNLPIKEKDNFTDTALFLGAGYQLSKFTFGLKYNVLYNEEKSVYTTPLIPYFNVTF